MQNAEISPGDHAIVEKINSCIDLHFRQKGRQLYHPIGVPGVDRERLIVDEEGFDKKWQAILSHIQKRHPAGLQGLKILDVGANSGFFSFNLAFRGAEVLSFEPDPGHSAISQCLCEHFSDCDVSWMNQPFDPDLVQGKKFDFALVLSVFQWMAKGGERLAEASRELRAISQSADAMFFELGYNVGKSCLTTDTRDHHAYLINFLKENTRYNTFELLLRTDLYPYRGIRKLMYLFRNPKRYLLICSNS